MLDQPDHVCSTCLMWGSQVTAKTSPVFISASPNAFQHTLHTLRNVLSGRWVGGMSEDVRAHAQRAVCDSSGQEGRPHHLGNWHHAGSQGISTVRGTTINKARQCQRSGRKDFNPGLGRWAIAKCSPERHDSLYSASLGSCAP